MKLIACLCLLGLISFQAMAKDVDWMHNYEDALAKAEKEKKQVMVLIYTDWCGYCRKLDREVYANAEVQKRLAQHYVSVRVNPEKSSKNAKLAKQFGASGFPKIVFVDSKGNLVGNLNGYVPATSFLQYLDTMLQKGAKR